MTSRHFRFAAPLLLAVAALAWAGELDPDLGVEIASGSRVTTAIGSAGDVDDFAFVGVPGQRLRARVKALGTPRAALTLELLRADGSPVAATDSGRLDATLDSSSAYVLRVRARAASPVGTYRLDVRQLPAPRHKETLDDTAGTGALAFGFEAGPGQLVAFDARVLRGDAVFQGIDDPDGRPVEELAGATHAARRRVRLAATGVTPGHAIGTYHARFDTSASESTARIRFRVRVTPARARRGEKRRTLLGAEPALYAAPPGAAVGERLVFHARDAVDPPASGRLPTALLGDVLLSDLREDSPEVFSAVVPGDLPLGAHTLRLVTATGQSAKSAGDVIAIRRPVLTAVDPTSGSEHGGFEVTLTGSSFPPPERLAIDVDGRGVPGADVLEATPTSIRLLAPPHAPGGALFRVTDTTAGIGTLAGAPQATYRDAPDITGVAPSAVPALGGETVVLTGDGFAATDRLFLEREDGGFDELTATQSAFVDGATLRFTAPLRAPGRYAVYAESTAGDRGGPGAALTAFSFVDATSAAGLAGGADSYDAAASATLDFDGDGIPDLVLARPGGASVADERGTRLLRGTQSGAFDDVSDDTLPEATAADDWRAHVVRVAFIDDDAWPDLVLGSDSDVSPAPTRSHVRILLNRARTPSPSGVAREFVDATDDLMAPVRLKSPHSFGDPVYEVGDAWHARDLWVGDLDGDGGRPEIVVTHDASADELNVRGIAGTQGFVYAYNSHWGGTRLMRFDAAARDGAGGFVFEENAFPRRSGVIVPILDGGSAPLGCYLPCDHAFPEFRGTGLAVEDLDGDGRRDVVVVSPQALQRRAFTGQPLEDTPSLQIGLRRHDALFDAEFTDMAAAVEPLGDSLAADVVAVGRVPGGADRLIALASRGVPAGGGRALRLLRPSPADAQASVPLTLADWTDRLPLPTAADHLEAAALAFEDLDGNGLDDLVLLAGTPPAAGLPGLRVLRAFPRQTGTLAFVPDYGPDLAALVTPTEDLCGDALTLGDLAGDGITSFVISREAPSGGGGDTRVVRRRAR